MFFALSGFLITYLLLVEKKKNSINVPHFYYRRILRIWPLYYLYLATSLAVATIYNIEYPASSVPFYVLLAANVPFLFEAYVPFVAHYWSVAVEEQFYLFWPWLVKFTHKYFLTKVMAIAGLLIVLKVLFHILPGTEIISSAIGITRVHCMMIGAGGAILYYRGNQLFEKISTHLLTQALCWIVMLLIILNKFHVASILDSEIVSVVTTLIIISQITRKNYIVSLDNRFSDFLGKISYGLYIIHPLLIFFLGKAIGGLNLEPILKLPLVYGSVLGLTILLSYVSYTYFEKPFLKIKNRFATVKSSGTAISKI